jgi:gluconolactonase
MSALAPLPLSGFVTLADGIDHAEGLTWDGHRILCGGEAGQIYAVTLGGRVTQIGCTDGFVLGLACDAQGRVYACDMKRREVLRFEPQSESLSSYSSGTAEEQMITPNHPAFDPAGNLYVTDSGDWKARNGKVFRVRADGEAEVWTRDVAAFPNGCCVDPDGDWLFVVQTNSSLLSRIGIQSDGSAGAAEEVARFPESVPDEVALAADGTIYVSCYRPDRIYRVDGETGAVSILAEDREGIVLAAPTSIAFVGERLDRLAIVNFARWNIAVADIGAAGCPLHRPQLSTSELSTASRVDGCR